MVRCPAGMTVPPVPATICGRLATERRIALPGAEAGLAGAVVPDAAAGADVREPELVVELREGLGGGLGVPLPFANGDEPPQPETPRATAPIAASRRGLIASPSRGRRWIRCSATVAPSRDRCAGA